MAADLSSKKYTADLPLDNFTPEQFLLMAKEAVKKLNWNINYINETGFIATTKNFLIDSPGEEVTVEINGSVANLKSEFAGQVTGTDGEKNKLNIEAFTSTFNSIKNSVFEKADEPETIPEPETTKDKITGFISVFIPRKEYFVTPVLINLNLVVFILMVASGVNAFLPDNESLLNWGANYRPLTLAGEWWRLLTSCFLHIGLIHIALNMYALLAIGAMLESYLGKTKFAVAYLLCGVLSSIASLWWHDNTISAGASGAIFGMYGVFLAMLTTNLIEKTVRKSQLSSILIFVGYNLVFGLQGGIDNAAHIGGLLGGLIIGYSFYPSLKKPKEARLNTLTIGLLCIGTILVSFFAYSAIPNDIGTYRERMKEFVSLEETALKIYDMPETASQEELLSGIKKKGIDNWNKSITLIKELDKLDIPTELHNRDEKLIQYCELRIKSYNFIYKGVIENTEQYKDSISFYDNQINEIINRLK